jgi:uncharacterized damage-inducible protein DinB
MIARQYDYGCWVRAKLLKLAGELSEEQYYADSQFGSLHTLLAHMVRTEWVWRNLAQTGTLPGPPASDEALATLEDVEAAWSDEEAAFRSYLATLSKDDLEGTVDTVSPAGDAYTFVRWEMLQHLLLHSMQHRTEAAALLTTYGKSPGDIDFLFFTIGRE